MKLKVKKQDFYVVTEFIEKDDIVVLDVFPQGDDEDVTTLYYDFDDVELPVVKFLKKQIREEVIAQRDTKLCGFKETFA